jgi:Cu/Ag efflux pump CusA
VAGEVAEGGLTSRVVVRFPERLRLHRDDLEALPVTTPGGAVIRLGEVARVRFDLGPGLVRRENVQRLATITANIAGSDLASVVDDAREALRTGLSLPEGIAWSSAGSSRRPRGAC